MRVVLAMAAVAIIVGGGVYFIRMPPPARETRPAPAPAPAPMVIAPVSTKPFDFSARLPPPVAGQPAPLPARPSAPAAIPEGGDPSVTVRDRERLPADRNGDMDQLRARGDPRAVEIFLGIATDPAETEVMRSWAVQHLGMSWPSMDQAQRAQVRTTLVAVIAQPTPGDLPPREALFALAQSEQAGERDVVIAAVDAGLGDDAGTRLDLYVRLAGELGLGRHRARAETLTGHSLPAVAGAAREAVRRLDGERVP